MPKKDSIQQLFDNIAPSYDRLNHIMSFGTDKGWRRKAVRQIADNPQPLEILDVATGTGDFALAIAKKAHPESHIVGIDLSEKMLEVGRQKVGERITLQQGDCEQLSFQDSTFDRVSVAFGIRNFEHLELGFKEMCRVLKPTGKLVILELSYPDNKFLCWCFKTYALKFLPWIGSKISGNGNAYHYLPDSILKFPKSNIIIPKLKESGFSRATVQKFTFGVCLMYIAEK